METLILTDEEVKALISMKEVMEKVEVAFKEKGLKRVQMPAKIYIFYTKYNGDLRAMPSYLEELDISAVKVVNVHVDNKEKYGLPTIMAMLVLVDPKNGFPLAIMGGKTITDIRTGAAGGIAAKHLARKDSKILALVGAGAQAQTQLAGLFEVYKDFEEVRVWSRSKETRQKFLAEAKQTYGNLVKFVSANEVMDAVKGADIVVTITPSRQPLVMNNMVSHGMHFNCIGADAPGKEELDPTILKRAKIVVDDWEQASHGGEINVPLSQGIIGRENIWGEIGEIVAGLKRGREDPEEITLFTSTGLAVQDALTAKIAYDKALSKGVGKFIKII